MARKKRALVRRYAYPRGGFSTRVRLFGDVFLFYVKGKAPKVRPEQPKTFGHRGFYWRARQMRSDRGERA